MDLKHYIINTITSISDAIIESQRELSSQGVIINPEKVEIGQNGEKLLRSDGWRYIQNLDFEILVAVDDDIELEGAGGLKVAGLFSIGGKMNESNSNQNTNKIKFTIPVAFPTSETPIEYTSKKGNYVIK